MAHAPGATRSAIALVPLVALLLMSVASPARAYWSALGSASGSGMTGTLEPPTGVTVPAAAAPDVRVSWTASDGVVGTDDNIAPPDGYFVTRYSGATGVPACGSDYAHLITATECTDIAVLDGDFTYVVTAVHETWTAAGEAGPHVVVENVTAVAFVGQPTDALTGTPLTPAVTVALRTADGDPYPDNGVPVTLAIGNNPGGAALAGTTTVFTDATGTATFTDLSVSNAGAGYTLTASSLGLSDAVSSPFTISPPFLGAAQNFAILAGSAVTNTGPSTVSGDVGVSPGTSITGLPDGTVSGDTHVNDPAAAAARVAFDTAYNDLDARPLDAEIVTNLAGLVLPPGVYHSATALALDGTLTLDGGGDPDAVFVFQADAAFDAAADSRVVLINEASAANVYWAVFAAAGIGENAQHAGNVLALGAITLGDGSTLIGRALSRAAVTLADTIITPTDLAPAPPSGASAPMAGDDGSAVAMESGSDLESAAAPEQTTPAEPTTTAVPTTPEPTTKAEPTTNAQPTPAPEPITPVSTTPDSTTPEPTTTGASAAPAEPEPEPVPSTAPEMPPATTDSTLREVNTP